LLAFAALGAFAFDFVVLVPVTAPDFVDLDFFCAAVPAGTVDAKESSGLN
jgi:hypothetical protein